MRENLNFVAIDVETANADLSSICQIGAATVRGGEVVDVWSELVDPEDEFDSFNVSIHGISKADVRGAEKFPEIISRIGSVFSGVVVSHSAFDRASLGQTSEKYRLALPGCTWLDSARIARRCWPDRYAVKGYGLAKVAADLGIEFRHHDAGEDARAAAEIVLHACSISGLDLDAWLKRIRQPIMPEYAEPIRKDGNPDGALFGEVLVFTGALSLPRREAAELAAVLGCTVQSGVTKHTTLLVVGDQDLRKLAGSEKSAKHQKAEKLIANGQPIRILRESDFKKMVSGAERPTLVGA